MNSLNKPFTILYLDKLLEMTAANSESDKWILLLESQLNKLLGEDYWDNDDPFPTVKCFNAMFKFLTVVDPQHRPGIGFTHDGEVILMWHDASNNSLVITVKVDSVNRPYFEIRYKRDHLYRPSVIELGDLFYPDVLQKILKPYIDIIGSTALAEYFNEI